MIGAPGAPYGCGQGNIGVRGTRARKHPASRLYAMSVPRVDESSVLLDGGMDPPATCPPTATGSTWWRRAPARWCCCCTASPSSGARGSTSCLALADAGFRAVAVDLRGYGASDKPPRGYDGYTHGRATSPA